MNRKSVTRARRKNLMKLGVIFKDCALCRDDDGAKLPKKERGYTVHATVNGYTIFAPNSSRFESMYGALNTAKFASELPTYIPNEEEETK